jgi:hypothetical protein
MRPAEVWLYGSVARGSHTVRSDLDVLVVSDAEVGAAFLKSAVSNLPQQQHLAARRYTWDEVAQMADYGSLFLVHLKLEGRRLTPIDGDSALSALLAKLPPYRLEDRDARGFWEALEDVEWGLDDAQDMDDIAFELGVLATVIRHCSILACYKLRDPQFQTDRSIATAFDGSSQLRV